MILIDSNLIIYAVQAQFKDLREWILETAIALKQQRKMLLGYALIAATCLEYQQTLATRNIDDFKWIENLALVNPMIELGYSE